MNPGQWDHVIKGKRIDSGVKVLLAASLAFGNCSNQRQSGR